MIRLAVLGSTRGTVLPALIEAIANQQMMAKIVTVISNKADAYILQRARNYAIPSHYLAVDHLTRQQYDQKMANVLQPLNVNVIVLMGYMRILSANFVKQFNIINSHPSLLPAHAGLMNHAVHQAVLAAGDKVTGCTVHYVTEQVDGGPIILQKQCLVAEGDTVETLKTKVQALEADAYIEAVRLITAG